MELIDRVVEAVCKSTPNPEARLEAMRLYDAFTKKAPEWGDTKFNTLAVEAPFFIPLGYKMFAVGVVDRITSAMFCEWKTHRAPKITKAGVPYKGDSEDDWLREITGGVQLAVYALAAREGEFLQKSGEKVRYPCDSILVRAALKSKPVGFWPAKWENGIKKFSDAQLDATRNALQVRGHQIRAARISGLVPWGVPGFHCFAYNRECHMYKDCTQYKYTPLQPKAWHHASDTSPDPGYVVCEQMGWEPQDPELVVLSQSAYQTYSLCMERGRVAYGGHVPGENSLELDTGTAYHAAMATYYGDHLESK